jgi:Fe-Mn family superoxide dismutase
MGVRAMNPHDDATLTSFRSSAMRYTIAPLFCRPWTLNGISPRLIESHYENDYGNALDRLNAITEELEALDPATTPGHVVGRLKRDEATVLNSTLLHELYFDNLAPKPPEPQADIRTAIAQRFGSLDRWVEDFKTCSMAANGWGILARDAVNGRLYNVSSDLHEVGVLWLGQPLIVCDVYEHAFYVDYQNRKADYVGKFLQFLDWDEINRRFQALAK